MSGKDIVVPLVMLLRAMDKCGCNGMCYTASILLSLTDCGYQEISLASSMHRGVATSEHNCKGRPSSK